MDTGKRKSSQLVGNMGLYYACYRLSKLGWNVLPTSRNAKGADLLIYDQTQSRRHTIQVKTLTKWNYIHGFKEPFADFLVVCDNIQEESPLVFSAKLKDYKKVLQKETARRFSGYYLRPSKVKKFTKGFDAIGRG